MRRAPGRFAAGLGPGGTANLRRDRDQRRVAASQRDCSGSAKICTWSEGFRPKPTGPRRRKASRFEQPASDGTPREDAEKSLALRAKPAINWRETIALTDLGVIGLNEGDPQRAINFLEQALTISRELEDKDREFDILGNLGMATLPFDSRREPRPLPARLAYARAKGDPYAEKLALERLAMAAGNLGDPNRAIATCEQVLAVTRRVGDRHQEANVLWHESIQFAELGQRDLAIAKAEESVTLFKLLGKPQAGWYGAYLQKYRMGLVRRPDR